MASYKVLSDNLAAGKQGDLIDEGALNGCNIVALIEAGHIAEVSKPSKVIKDSE